jgi:hypothetical protein
VTPDLIAADRSLHGRFLTEIAYCDRAEPSDAEVEADLALLASNDGVLVISWFWPHMFLHDVDRDPFDEVARDVRDLERRATEELEAQGFEHQVETLSRMLDHRRWARRRRTAERFERILDSTSRAVDRSVEDLMAHLRWTVPLAERELVDLLQGRTPFPLGLAAAICRALQLEFETGLALSDPEGLARRIDESTLALSIAGHLRHLTLDNLEAVRRKLPRGATAMGAVGAEIYPAPAEGSRYSSLYEALSSDERDLLHLTLVEIDTILEGGGEPPLPASARVDRSWWAGTGMKAEGRPQISAWWGAGYRIFTLATDRSTGHVTSVGFEALPGRSTWLLDPDRKLVRGYRAPSPYRVPIYPVDERGLDNLRSGLRVAAEAFKALAERVPLRTLADGVGQVARTDETPAVPEDADVRKLVELLSELGEGSRSQVLDHFTKVRGERVDDAWITNLLTRARRQGWTVNVGTRKQPRWVVVDRTCPTCGANALEPLTKGQSRCPRCGHVVPARPADRAGGT